MVEFVYGLPGSGKTSYIMSRLAIDAKAGRRAFLIVPEQAASDRAELFSPENQFKCFVNLMNKYVKF